MIRFEAADRWGLRTLITRSRVRRGFRRRTRS